MANLTQRQSEEVREWAAHYIPFLIQLWEELPEIANTIDSWDEGEALTYIFEWPLYEDQRSRLNEHAGEGVLTSSQLRQLEQLNQIAEERKPIVN